MLILERMSRSQPIFPRALRRDVIVVVALKLVVLVILQQVFFSSADRVRVTPQAAAEKILATSQPR